MKSKNILGSKYEIKDNKEEINSFIKKYLENSSISNKCEIELRLGKYSFNNKINLNLLKDCSNQNFIILNNLTTLDKYRFNANIEEIFFNLKFDICLNNNENLVNQNDIIFDFIFKNSRYQYYPNKNEFYLNSKTQKKNIDLLHNSIDIRLSCSYENNKKIDQDEFIKVLQENKIEYIRAKIRRNFIYEYMELSFTKVFMLDYFKIKNQNLIQKIITLISSNEKNNYEKLFNLIYHISNIEHNIELEIIDNKFVLENLKRNYFDFDKIIMKLFRTLEIVSLSNKSFCYKKFIKKFNSDNLPEIGNYIENYL